MDSPSFDVAWVVHGKVAFASLCGGIVRLLFKPADSIVKTIWLLFGCVTCGFYATPALVQFFGVDPSYRDAIAATSGFLGLTVAGGILAAVEAFDFKGWIRGMVPRGTSGQD